MKLKTLKKPSLRQTLSTFQIMSLYIYLFLNIINIGENQGTGLPYILVFIVFSVAVLLIESINKSVFIRLHLLFFILFVVWLSLKIVIDLYDTYYLKQITIGTTGGIFLFFTLGTFSRQAFDIFKKKKLSQFNDKLLILTFFFLSYLILSSFKVRLQERSDIFFIENVNSGYQRPGNFIIIMFIVASLSYISISSHKQTKSLLPFIFWFSLYSLGLSLLLISSQMIGSNTATINLISTYLITCVISFFSFNKDFRFSYLNNEIRSFLSKKIAFNIIKYSILILIIVFTSVVTILHFTGFDLSKMRIFGFGSGKNSSLESRLNIFKETGLDQLSYAPIIGEFNVANIVTGNPGEYLHSFIPNIISHLGFIGLLIVSVPFILVFSLLYRSFKHSERNAEGFHEFIKSLWFSMTLLFFLFYANLAVDKSWIVVWFYLGFSMSAIYTKVKNRDFIYS